MTGFLIGQNGRLLVCAGEEMDRTIDARIKASIEAFEKLQKRSPFIFIHDGNYWLNPHARKLISRKAIPLDDFIEWLRMGVAHLKNLSYDDLIINIMQLPGGAVMVFLKQADKGAGACPRVDLTIKEREVLRFVIRGFSNKKIAESMKISPQTVNAHLDHVYQKLGCSNRAAAVAIGLKNGLFIPRRGGNTHS